MTQFYFSRVFVLLKPDVIDKMGEILKVIANHGFHIKNMKMIQLTSDEITRYFTKNINDET